MTQPDADARIAPMIDEWKAIQSQLRSRMIVTPLNPLPRFVAGADGAFSADKTHVLAAAVVYDRIGQRIIEVNRVKRRGVAPYVPGFLSFREGPALLDAIRGLKHEFGAICFDGQGYAHPRRCGLATHLGVTLDVPSVGVAKSRFIGAFEPPTDERGASSPLTDRGETIGVVLRTRVRCNPLFISVGHRVDLASAQALVMSCLLKYRIPEPTRQADIEVAVLKR